MKKFLAMILCFGMVFGVAACGGAEEPKQEEVVEQQAEQEEVVGSAEDEQATEDVNAWFEEWYGGEDEPFWYDDVEEIKIINLENGKRSLVIESTTTDESVASSMAMIIWGFDDTIEFVSVYDQNGNTLYTNY